MPSLANKASLLPAARKRSTTDIVIGGIRENLRGANNYLVYAAREIRRRWRERVESTVPSIEGDREPDGSAFAPNHYLGHPLGRQRLVSQAKGHCTPRARTIEGHDHVPFPKDRQWRMVEELQPRHAHAVWIFFQFEAPQAGQDRFLRIADVHAGQVGKTDGNLYMPLAIRIG